MEGTQPTQEVVVSNGLPSAEQMGVMLREETERQKHLDTFIKENLKKEVDYGVIPGCGNNPTLFKAGAEKVLGLFNLRAEYNKDTDTLEMLGKEGVVAYRCRLIDRKTDNVVGEGRGVAEKGEKSSWNLNTQVKICEKRSMVDAVLQTFGLSSRYTQDVEDRPTQQGSQSEATPQENTPVTENQKRTIRSLLDKLGMQETSLESQIKQKVDHLTSSGASNVIKQLLNLKVEKKKESETVDTTAYDDIPVVEPEKVTSNA